MIKFFKNIRQKSLVKNKVSQYLLYAIGEIILVVIGILIALQINNWNENRKNKGIVKNYYTQILKDLAKDHVRINEDIDFLESNIMLHKKFVENLSNQKNPEAIIMSSAKLNYLTSYIRFNTNTVETLQTTGDIKLISTEIRNKLIELKNYQDNITKTRFNNNDNFRKELVNATILGYNQNTLLLRGTAREPNQLYKDLKIADNTSKMALSIISAYFAKDVAEQDHLFNLNSMIKDVDNLFKIINKELDNPYENIEMVVKPIENL